MAESVIPEPQRTYVLELLAALGSAAQGFVLVGAQALKFVLPHARGTRDFDFVLDVLALRDMDISLTAVLHSLGYRPCQAVDYSAELVARSCKWDAPR